MTSTLVTKGDETEEKIMKAALELFVRKGYHGTSINDIMRKVGLTKGALYSHFSGKGEVLLRIIRKFKSQYIDALIREGNEYQGNALEKFHHIINFSARFSAENHDLCIFLHYLTTELKASVDFEPALRSVYREFHTFIRQLIQQGVRQGVFRKDINPDLAGYIYMALHDGALHQWVLHHDYMDAVEYMRCYRAILSYGLVDKDAGTALRLE